MGGGGGVSKTNITLDGGGNLVFGGFTLCGKGAWCCEVVVFETVELADCWDTTGEFKSLDIDDPEEKPDCDTITCCKSWAICTWCWLLELFTL